MTEAYFKSKRIAQHEVSDLMHRNCFPAVRHVVNCTTARSKIRITFMSYIKKFEGVTRIPLRKLELYDKRNVVGGDIVIAVRSLGH